MIEQGGPVNAGSSSSLNPAGSPRSGRLAFPWDYVLALSVLALVCVWKWHGLNAMINPDAVAYMRLAGYWTSGQFDLAVNGYWGPMLSWMIALLQLACGDPLRAAWLAVVVSGLVYIAGCLQVLRAFELPHCVIVVAALPIGTITAAYGLREITPDVLVHGLVMLGLAELIQLEADSGWGRAVRAGVWLGLGYLTKGDRVADWRLVDRC